MAKSNDDLADALAALAGGQVPDEPQGSGTDHAAHAPPPAPAAPARSAAPGAPVRSAAPASKAPVRPPAAAPASPARAAAPPVQRSAAPVPPVAPTRAATPTESPARPAAPSRPTAPPVAAAPPAAAPSIRARPVAPTARPVAPIATPLQEPPAGEPPAEDPPAAEVDPQAIYDDGDAVIVPPPAPEVFQTRPKPAPRPRTHYTQTLEFKRTVVPVMLTVGVIALVSALLPIVSSSESAFAPLKEQMLYLLLLGGVGVVFLAFAIFNALQIKHILEMKKRESQG